LKPYAERQRVGKGETGSFLSSDKKQTKDLAARGGGWGGGTKKLHGGADAKVITKDKLKD